MATLLMCTCGEFTVSDLPIFPFGHSTYGCDPRYVTKKVEVEEPVPAPDQLLPFQQLCECHAYRRAVRLDGSDWPLPKGHHYPPDRCIRADHSHLEETDDDPALERIGSKTRRRWDAETVYQVRTLGTQGGINVHEGDIVCHCELPEGEESLPPHLWEPLVTYGLSPRQGKMAAIMKHVRANRKKAIQKRIDDREANWDF